MKLKRMVACVLALLLMVSLLPMAAMATDNEDNNATISTPIDTNTGNSVTVTKTGSIQTNEGTVSTNNGKIVENKQTVVNNVTLRDNYKDPNYNSGCIETNMGTVTNNGVAPGEGVPTGYFSGYVKDNQGTIENNYGTVNTNKDTVVTNACHVEINNQTVTTNRGTIYKNGSNQNTTAKVETNAKGGKVDFNFAEITTNDGEVSNNQSTGEIETNNGTVLINQERGTIGTNNGTVENNRGTVETNTIDGVVNNSSRDSSEGTVTQNFGTMVDKTSDVEKTYYGLSWGDNVQSLTLLKGDVEAGTTGINLGEYAAKASRSGYKMTGYTAFARKDGEDSQITGDTTNYLMDAPVWLQILWEKLGGKSTQPTRTPVYTKLSADQVKVGAFVRCGNMTFKIIEVTDDSIRVATVGKLSDAALADMLGFLKQHLSEAQIAKLIGEPELLEQELVSKFFGGSDEHIAFYASPDLFA